MTVLSMALSLTSVTGLFSLLGLNMHSSLTVPFFAKAKFVRKLTINVAKDSLHPGEVVMLSFM